VLVEERGVDTDFRGDVPEVAGEAGAYLAGLQAGPVGVFLRRDREELLVTLAVEGIGRVVKAGLRDGANFVEQRDDVDEVESYLGELRSLLVTQLPTTRANSSPRSSWRK
jgi:hypothetical protein